MIISNQFYLYLFFWLKFAIYFEFQLIVFIYQSLVGSIVIDAKFGRDNRSSIPATAIGRELEPLNARTDPEPD
jgi:hypothetical protein